MDIEKILIDAQRHANEREARQHRSRTAAAKARAKKWYEQTQRHTKQGIKWTKRREEIAAFYQAGNTLKETGIHFDISSERVRQILAKVKKHDQLGR